METGLAADGVVEGVARRVPVTEANLDVGRGIDGIIESEST